ncbi:MAG: hypothetical protein R3C14_39745 [Caldilineaceae bacterium]
MQYDILLTKHPNNGYTARPILLPELIIHADNELEVLDRVRQAINEVQAHSRIVQIEAEPTEAEDDPWLRFAGMWVDDPDWEIFQSAVAAFRQQIDNQTSDNSTGC